MFCGSGLYGAELSAAVVLLSELCKITTKSSLFPLTIYTSVKQNVLGKLRMFVDKMHH